MRLFIATVAFAVCLSAGLHASSVSDQGPVPLPPEAVTRAAAALRDIVREASGDNPDLAKLSGEIDAVMADPAFVAVSDEERHRAYLLRAALCFDRGDLDCARGAIQFASTMPQAVGFDWQLRLRMDLRSEDFADGALAATRLARNWPDELAHFTDGAIFRLAREAEKSDAAAAFALLTALHDLHWKPQGQFSDADALWLALMRIDLERADASAAIDVSRDLVDPVSFVLLHADKRFDPVVRADPAHFDVMKQYDTVLADMRSRAAAAPDRLEGVVAVAGILKTLGRTDEAFALLDGAVHRATADPKAYSDFEDQISWAQDRLSNALLALGRTTEGLAAMEKAAAHRADGSRVNVNQSINLAGIYVLYGRADDALAATAAITDGDASPYGRMALRDVRACAYFLRGDRAKLDETLSYMRAHRHEGAQPFLDTMLFIGDLDAAAGLVIEELNDPLTRAGMLKSLQDYRHDPNQPPKALEMYRAWLAVRARADVAAAIAATGRIESYPLYL